MAPTALRLARTPIDFLARLARWRGVAAERRCLARLDDRRLDDLGLSRAEVESEAQRPFWDLPSAR